MSSRSHNLSTLIPGPRNSPHPSESLLLHGSHSPHLHAPASALSMSGFSHHDSSPGTITLSERRVARLLMSPEEKRRQRREELHRYRMRQIRTCLKQFRSYLFSQLGLSALVLAYILIGGGLFHHLEKEYEEKEKAIMKAEREQVVKNLSREVWLNDYLNDETLFDLLTNYSIVVVNHLQEQGWNGKFDSESWSYTGSILYAVTVITTIGYGHAAPRTNSGRIATIVYAIIGIPLTFFFLSNIGDAMARVFKTLYFRICLRITGKAPVKEQQKPPPTPGSWRWMKLQCRKCCSKKKRHPRAISKKTQGPLVTQFPNEDFVSEGTESESGVPAGEVEDSASTVFHKFYCSMHYLPSKQKERVYENLLKATSCLQEEPEPVPVLNWRDIDSELEVASLRNMPQTLFNGWNTSDSPSFSAWDRRRAPEPNYLVESPALVPAHSSNQAQQGQTGAQNSGRLGLVEVSEEDTGPSTSSSNSATLLQHSMSKSFSSNSSRNSIRRNQFASPSETLVAERLHRLRKFRSLPMCDQEKLKSLRNLQQSCSLFGTKVDLLDGREDAAEDSTLFEFPSIDPLRRISYQSQGWSASGSLFTFEMDPLKDVNVDDITVPISLSLGLMSIYILFGAAVFLIWDDNENPLDELLIKWAYFCLITLSTIGFGDIVPGNRSDPTHTREKMIFLVFYVPFGLAVVAMCFKLMQEEVVAKVKRLARVIRRITSKPTVIRKGTMPSHEGM